MPQTCAARTPARCTLLLAALALAALGLCPVGVALPQPPRPAPADVAEGRNGVVVSVSAPASEVGLAVLKEGGNAVDAAVATAFALAVTYPPAGNVGGGGFMLVHPGGGAEPVVVEYREKAPAAATRTMFTNQTSQHGHKVVGVPGTVRGLALAHQRFGKLPWKSLVLPAVKLAEEGFPVDAHVAQSLNAVLGGSPEFPELRRVLSHGQGAWRAGSRLVQKDLARTLRRLAEEGPDAFYTGALADEIVAEMKSGGGLITREDLAGYRANVRQPVHGSHRGYDVYAPPPPSSGGTCLVEMLNVLENFDLRKQGRWSPQTLHLLTEVMRRAYRDRARYLGDSDFVKVPAHLTGKGHARKLAGEIDPNKATPSADLAGDIPLAPEGDSTTHFSIIDGSGMAVANTYTLEHSFGSRVMVKGAGFLLNNEMTDFNWRPGHTDRKGAIGTPANEVAPGKRMLSSQCPTVVARDGKVVLVTGSPGGRTIINTVLCVLVNVLDFDMDLRSAVDAQRQHHQWFPDVLHVEGINKQAEAVARLRQMGHTVRGSRQGDAHSIWVDRQTGRYYGAADRRLSGKALAY